MCPHCGAAAVIKAQCHVASTFQGDERGRFCNNTYQLNQDMIWWSEDDPRWPQWTDGGELANGKTDLIDECCIAHCETCNTDLFAVITFEPIKPVKLKQLGLERDWPSSYKK